MTLAEESLSSKYEALSSTQVPPKKKKITNL
jgi:hypothetical protein